MKFIWDENKRNINLQKHGIDFHDASEIFSNFMLVKLDQRFDYGEDRYIGLGLIQNCVVVLVYTEPIEETIRIISIRKATKGERNIYEKYVSNRLGKSE